MAEEIIDLDVPILSVAEPGSAVEDALRWLPIIRKFVAAIQAAIAGGSLEVPATKVRLFGKTLTLGPWPIKIEG